MATRSPSALHVRMRQNPGRGGCGVGAVADLEQRQSHELVDMAMSGLCSLEHRGGQIDNTGDGAGLLLATDTEFFARFVAAGRHLPAGHHLSVGVFFFPAGEAGNVPHWQHEIDATLRSHGLAPLGWRRVPVNESALGTHAFSSRRSVWQLLIGEGMVPHQDLTRTLFHVKASLESKMRDVYIVSLSAHTLVYKALATGEQLARYYPDLSDPDLKTNCAVFHRRFSTNTFSNWSLAQVFRTLCHNGEVNTIKSNRNAVQNLEAELGLRSVLMPQGSDSADMDRVVELFVAQDLSLLETVVRMMPMAWRDMPRLTPEVVRFYQGVQRAFGSLGAWEGPTALVATDGTYLVGALDRMGLRPMRYVITHSGLVILGSEMGAVSVLPGDIKETGQLDPGQVFAVHLREHKILRADDILQHVVANTPINFGELSENHLISLPRRQTLAKKTGPARARKNGSAPDNAVLNLFGWTKERRRVTKHMATVGKEPITSMGYDRPLPVFSAQRPPLTKYFKQIVAVVTNPPFDPIREGSAFDLTVHLGAAPAIHQNRPVFDPRPQYKLASPILAESQFRSISSADRSDRPTAILLDGTFDDPQNGRVAGARAISGRIAELCRQATGAIKRSEGSILICSDRKVTRQGAKGTLSRVPLPMVLLVSALHNALVAAGLRRRAGIVVETGEIQEGHDAAVFVANGADCVFPYLFYQLGTSFGSEEKLAVGLERALMRVMSKMGICSVDGYRGSRLFEAVGIDPSIVEYYLPGVTSRLGGLELSDIYQDIAGRRKLGKAPQRDADMNVYRKEVWSQLQITARGHDPEAYSRFVALVEDTPPIYVRDLLRFVPADRPLALSEVMSSEDIIASCFRGAAMSHGALHRVAHKAIAAAFNSFGAYSNCGEGGEDARRDRGGPWEEARSRIRQVASGRFGVEARYLVHADELSIKIGQGAKPGEGGMLPGHKVTAEVAMIRRTKPGVTLISPPPHHDIYSIEDLAQLIYSLKQVNPAARISVKVPGVTDIGTIAVGIVKAGAHTIEVSGFEGGTGAAVASSIEHAGLPLERALSETHQALVLNGVRHRVRLRADGGIKTGRDVAKVLALGADEVSIGTALMIAEQCIFCHGCANGMCPAGITTQNDLIARRLMTEKKGREKDDKLPDIEEERYQDAKNGVRRYLLALANHVRGFLAEAGVRTPAELTGRIDRLSRRPDDPLENAGDDGEPPASLRRTNRLDLSEIVFDPFAELPDNAHPSGLRGGVAVLDSHLTGALNARLCNDAAAGSELCYDISVQDRTVGATLAGKITLGEITCPAGGFSIRLRGCAGQALGFACVDGLRIALEGFANDCVAEAMGGGVVALWPPREIAPVERGRHSTAGNAAAYGATGGKLFVEGRVGQRVGVRNSGATIVVEGAGKYAFEYMTGGVGVVLGRVGAVVASGFTGGVLYLLSDDQLAQRVHDDAKVVALDEHDQLALRALIEEHQEQTDSHVARGLLGDWAQEYTRFVKIVPTGS